MLNSKEFNLQNLEKIHEESIKEATPFIRTFNQLGVVVLFFFLFKGGIFIAFFWYLIGIWANNFFYYGCLDNYILVFKREAKKELENYKKIIELNPGKSIHLKGITKEVENLEKYEVNQNIESSFHLINSLLSVSWPMAGITLIMDNISSLFNSKN